MGYGPPRPKLLWAPPHWDVSWSHLNSSPNTPHHESLLHLLLYKLAQKIPVFRIPPCLRGNRDCGGWTQGCSPDHDEWDHYPETAQPMGCLSKTAHGSLENSLLDHLHPRFGHIAIPRSHL